MVAIHRLAVAVTAIALAGAIAGCSFVFSEGAPFDHQRRAAFDCGESLAPPILDTAVAGLGALALASPDDGSSDSSGGARVTSAILVSVYAASAIYGYVAVDDCRGAKAARAETVARASGLPPPYGGPPYLTFPYGAPPPVWPPGADPAIVPDQPPPGPRRLY